MDTPIPKISLPDLRFESSFRRSLHAKAKATQIASAKSSSASTSTDPSEPIAITPLVIIQVVLKDVIIMPLAQGIVWSSILILAKPWLTAAARHGREVGVRLYNSLGFSVRKFPYA